MKNETAIVIFSVYRDNKPAEINCANHAKALHVLEKKSVVYATGTGCYEGNKERCIMVVCYNKKSETVARYLAARYEQESVLYVDAARRARLETPGGDLIAPLGDLVSVTRAQATKLDAWTLINGRYWVTRETSTADTRAARERALIEFANDALGILAGSDQYRNGECADFIADSAIDFGLAFDNEDGIFCISPAEGIG